MKINYAVAGPLFLMVCILLAFLGPSTVSRIAERHSTAGLAVEANELADAVALSTEEIAGIFANVRDEAQVQDSAGTTAVSHWYADGTFTNEWTNSAGSGTVTGRWHARDNQRCIEITSGLPEQQGQTKCGHIYRRGPHYISLNADGSIHGVHALSPIN